METAARIYRRDPPSADASPRGGADDRAVADRSDGHAAGYVYRRLAADVAAPEGAIARPGVDEVLELILPTAEAAQALAAELRGPGAPAAVREALCAGRSVVCEIAGDPIGLLLYLDAAGVPARRRAALELRDETLARVAAWMWHAPAFGPERILEVAASGGP